jgi:hypothetical protein
MASHLDSNVAQTPDGSGSQETRRRVIKAGAALLPVILTLRATPAWAQTDYTTTAYRYGTNKGLCRNPKFDPNASPQSTEGQEFVPCADNNPLTPTVPGSGSRINEKPRGF